MVQTTGVMRSLIPPHGVGAWVASVLSPLLGLIHPAFAQSLEPLRDYSVIVSGNLTTTSEIEGRTLVGGNLTGQNSANFAIKLQNLVPSSDLTLRVGGDIGGGNPIQLNAGSLELGGTLNRSVNYNGGGSLVPNPGVDYSAIFFELTAASSVLESFEANSTASIPSGQPGPLDFQASPDASGLAVFDLDGALIFDNSSVQQLQITPGTATEIVINVGGVSIDWTNGNLVGLFTGEYWRSHLIWNFYEAETIDFGSRNIMGQVLAPHASVTTTGNIDGSIFAKNLDTRAEVHLPGYQGNINLIPEPATSLLGLLGACLLLRRRRSV